MVQPVDAPIVCPLLVGRAGHLAALRERFDAAIAGRGQMVLIAGEAGIGKSRLVTEAVLDARRLGVPVLTGQCFEQDRTLPLVPILDLPRDATRQDPSAATEAALADAIPELSLLLPVLGRLAPECVPAPSLGPEHDRRRAIQTLTRLVRTLAAEQPLLLVIEDVHWSDETTLDALLDLARGACVDSAVFLIATYRSDEIGPDLDRLLATLDRERHAVEIRLDPLSPQDAGEMPRAMGKWVGHLPAGTVDTVVALAEGNPFFIEELLRSAVADAAARPAPISVPGSVNEAVQRRAARLGEPTRQTLTLAAVAGRRFDFALLQALGDCDDEEMLRRVKELIGAGLVVADPAPDAPPDGRFAFRHALTRQAIYAGLLAPERRALHRAVFAAMHRGQEDDRGQGRLTADLARHAFAAGAWEEARANGRQAGEQASALYAPRAAAEHFTRAIEATARLGAPPSSVLHRGRGHAFAVLGDFDNARRDFETAVALARAAEDRGEEGDTLLALGELWMGRDYAAAGAYLHAAHDAAAQTANRAALAHCLNRLGNWHVNLDRPADAFQRHQDALLIFEDLEDQRGIAETLDLLGMARYLAGDCVGSAAAYRRVIPLLREVDDRRTLVNALTALSFTMCSLDITIAVVAAGSFAERLALVEEAVRIAREIGGRAEEAFALCCAGLIAGERQVDEGLDHARRGLRIAEEIGHRQWAILAHYVHADLYRILLDTEAARRHLDAALTNARAFGTSFWLREVLADLAVVQALNGDIDGAEETIAEAVGDDTPMQTFDQRDAWLAWAQVALASGQPERALEIVDRLIVAAPDAEGDLMRLPHLAQLRGETLMAMGRSDEAAAAREAARDGALAQEHLPLLWCVHLARAALFRGLGRRDNAADEIGAAHAAVAAIAAGLAHASVREAFEQRAAAILPPLRAASPRRAAKAAYDGLTAREREVAALIAAGCSNRQIGDTLFMSERTAATHVGSILGKLGMTTRAQVAAWAQKRGPMNRVDPGATAFAHRDARYQFIAVSASDDPADDARGIAWARGLHAATETHALNGAFLNFNSLDPSDRRDRVRTAHGDNWDRLVAVKRRYDPTNVFRENNNIVP